MLLVHPTFRLLSVFYCFIQIDTLLESKQKLLVGRHYITKVKQSKRTMATNFQGPNLRF